MSVILFINNYQYPQLVLIKRFIVCHQKIYKITLCYVYSLWYSREHAEFMLKHALQSLLCREACGKVLVSSGVKRGCPLLPCRNLLIYELS